MKILLLTTHLNYGGIATYAVELGRELCRRGHRVYLASSGGELEEKAGRSGMILVRVPLDTKSEFSPKLPVCAGILIRLCRREKIELIHSQTRVSQVLGQAVARFCGIRFLATCHGFFRVRFCRFLLPAWGERTIAVSSAVKIHLEDDFRMSPDRIRLIPNGIDLSRFPPAASVETKRRRKEEMGLDGKKPVVGTISRLVGIKGHECLLRAAPAILAERPETQFFLVGEGPAERELRELCRRLALEGKIRFRPGIADTALALTAMDVFVFPSLEEGLGISLLEAMACGLPAVASRVGGIPDLIRNENEGLLVPPGDADALAKAVLRLMKDEKLREKLGGNARRRAEKEFTLEKMGERVEAVYRELVNS